MRGSMKSGARSTNGLATLFGSLDCLGQSVFYRILPQVTVRAAPTPECSDCVEERYRIRHHGLYAPRDFDISPYFGIVKPTLDGGFDYRTLRWDAAEGDAGRPTRRYVPADQRAPTA